MEKKSRYGYVGCSKDFFSPGKTWLRRRACVCILFEKGFNKPRVWGRIKVFPPGQLFLSFSTGGATLVGARTRKALERDWVGLRDASASFSGNPLWNT